RLDAAVHHFGEAGEIGDLAHRQAGIADQLVRAAGRYQLDTSRAQPAREVGHAGFVEYRKQRPPDLDRLAHWVSRSWSDFARSLARSGGSANGNLPRPRGSRLAKGSHLTMRASYTVAISTTARA